MTSKTETFFKGISITTIFTIAGGIIGVIYFAVMSRFLSKADFGYFAALTGIMAVISAVADAGLGAAIVQKKDADKNFISTAFTMSIALGLISFILIYFLAPILANIIADDYLTMPLRIIAITLISHSFISVANAQLYRSLKFKRIGIISFISNVINTSLSVILAKEGFGLYAMVSYIVFGSFLTMVLLYTTSTKIPRLSIHKKYIKGIFSYGGWLTLSIICNKISTYIDRIVLPRMTSVEILGAYTRPASFTNNITGAFTDIMDKVLFPMLSDIQDNKETAIRVFYRAVELLNSFSVILGCVFFFNADLIIRIFFGEEWLELVSILQIVSFTSVFFINTQLVDCFFRSLNFVRTGFYIRLFALFWNLFCIYWGSKYGVTGIAVSLTIANIFIIVLKMIVLSKKIEANTGIMVKRWIVAWKSAILPILIGMIYICLFPKPSMGGALLFAVVYFIVIFVIFMFYPRLIGREYEKTIYPVLSKFIKIKK